MPAEATAHKLEQFMEALGARVRGPGSIYLTGGTTALQYGWRDATVDIGVLSLRPLLAGARQAAAPA